MKKKTIEKIINSKFDDFISSIADERVRNLVRENTIITGGCIASMLLKERVNDYDIYFRDRETTLAVAKYYIKEFKEENKINHSDGKEVDIWVDGEDKDRVKIHIKSAGVASETSGKNYEYFEGNPDASEEYLNQVTDKVIEEKTDNIKRKYRPVFISANAITLSDDIQIVIRFYGDPDNIHQHYDYVHCTNYWTSKDRKVTLKQPALEALLAKELIYVGSKYPIASIVRTRKFIKRGFHINAGQYLKMAYQISDLDLNDLEVLEDQLTGVDVAYFHELVDGLKNHHKSMQKQDKEFNLNYGYLATLIDKIF